MAQIQKNGVIYGSNNASDIVYRDITVEEKLDSVPYFDIANNEDVETNDYLTYSHIIDNLTSTSTNNILSANQGKILNDKISTLSITHVTDKNTLNTSVNNLSSSVTTNTNNIASNKNNITTLTTWKNNHLNTYHPVGSVCVTSTNKAPTFGGTWTLIDKKFTPSHTNSSTNGTLFTINSTNTKSHSTYVIREGHILRIRSNITTKVALKDGTVALGTYKFADLGISSLTSQTYTIGYSDGGNVMNMLNIIQDTGVLNHYDIVGADSLAAEKIIQFDVIVPIHYTQMVDAKCNRFYWKRTA